MSGRFSVAYFKFSRRAKSTALLVVFENTYLASSVLKINSAAMSTEDAERSVNVF